MEITIKLPDHCSIWYAKFVGNMKSIKQVDILENDCCKYIHFVQGISICIYRQQNQVIMGAINLTLSKFLWQVNRTIYPVFISLIDILENIWQE